MSGRRVKMTLKFLGTGSQVPNPIRGVSATALRIEGESWMFDCGGKYGNRNTDVVDFLCLAASTRTHALVLSSVLLADDKTTT